MSVDDSLVAYGVLINIIWVVCSVTSCHAKGTSVFVTKTLYWQRSCYTQSL